MNSATTIGVVIVTYNSGPEIGACLESIQAATTQPVRVVVVDNASRDDTVARIRLGFPNIELIANSTNVYYAAASNQGIAALGTPFVLFLNPDTVLPVGGIDALRRTLESHPRAAAVAPRLVGSDGARQHSVRQFPGLDTLWYDLTGLAFLAPRSPKYGRWRMTYWEGGEHTAVEQPMASCLLVRGEVLATVGAFDERYPMFFNDVDWCRRVHDAGFTIRYDPDVTVRHVGGASTARRKVAMIWMGHFAYLRYLHRLYTDSIPARIAVWCSAPFVVAAAVLRTLWWGVIRRLV